MASHAETVTSHTDQPAATDNHRASTVLPPYSAELSVDKHLKWGNKNLKETIKTFYENEQLSAIDQLKTTPPYPTPHMLAQFASKAYADNQYDEPKPPACWKLLTTASNSSNKYFGTAYLHPKNQQVVIAHRGTDSGHFIAFLKDVYADLKGVVYNDFVDQMNSASTFANTLATVLQEIEQEMKVSFELFFTGHSLGGWLAQITTFTIEYLEVKKGIFLKKQKTELGEENGSGTVQEGHDIQKFGLWQSFKDKLGTLFTKGKTEPGEENESRTGKDSLYVRHNYHPHTVVFESPGCETMLLKLKATFDVRYLGSSIDLQHLDITSYLSAPNRINTCNPHLGSVYRIFTDLSDMGLLDEYNLTAHSMNNILKAFDSKTEQVDKDNKVALKIQEVVDWPVATGLTSSAECKEFFKWANKLNNYHPEVKNITYEYVPTGYAPIRYQTKVYDECTKSLSIFTQNERMFLEGYLALPQLKNTFVFENFFSLEINSERGNEVDYKAEEERAEHMLQNFQLESKRIRCPDAGMIPYVRRLLRHFPHIPEQLKEKLSSSEIINRACRDATQRNVKKVDPKAFEFKPAALGLKEFLDSDQKIGMTDGDAWKRISDICYVLQNTSCAPEYFCDGHYTILELQWLLTVKRVIKMNALLESMETPHLLMIACNSSQPVDDELTAMFKELFNILKQKTMKIILTTNSEVITHAFVQKIATDTLGEGFITTVEQLTWGDLTISSQNAILGREVNFQGRKIALNQLTSAESMTKSFPLEDLLQEKELRIGKEPVISASSGYNENYYIDRTFNHNIVIRQEILSDKLEGKFADLMANTEQEFNQLCENNPNTNVHWVVKDNSGELVWQQSQGDLNILRKYIDAQKSHCYATGDLDKLLEQAKHQRVMIIADEAGMGKTAVLTHLSKRIMNKHPAHWLVRINVNNHKKQLEAQKGLKMDKGDVLGFVSREVLKLKSNLEKELFKKCFEGNYIKNLVVIVDGCDEISPDHKQTVIDMLQILKETSLEQLWVTTRPHLKEELEDSLQRLSYTLQPFTEFQQVEFLENFWLKNVNCGVTNQHIYATALLRKFAQSISDKNKVFSGNPLQIRLLAEAFKEDIKSFNSSDKSEPELPHKLDLLGLYIRCIDTKYDIYCEEKSGTPAIDTSYKKRGTEFSKYRLGHQLLALNELFTEDDVPFLQIYDYSTFSDKGLARFGIVQINNEGKLQFIHRTCAELHVAEFLTNQLKKETKLHAQVQDFLLNKVLLGTDCHVIRAFLDGLLKNSKPSNKTLEDLGKKLQLGGCKTALHRAAAEDNAHIIACVLNKLSSGDRLSVVKELLLASDNEEQTVWHKAAQNGSVQALRTLWEWAKQLTTLQVGPEIGYVDEVRHLIEQIKDIIFNAKDKYGNTTLHGTAQGGSLEVLQALWKWANDEKINPRELLLAKNKEGNTAWQVAAQTGNLKIVQDLGFWAKGAQLNRNDLKHNLLLAKDQYGYTVWYRAAESGCLEALETIWILGKELKLKPEEMLLAPGKDGNTAWQVAVQKGHFKVLQKLWKWANDEQMDRNVLTYQLLLAKDKYGYTAWHRAAQLGNLKALDTLWSWVKKADIDTDELKRKLFLAVGEQKETAWHLAADTEHFEILDKMWVWAKETQRNPDDLINELLLAQDQHGYTLGHRVAQNGSLQALQTLWS